MILPLSAAWLVLGEHELCTQMQQGAIHELTATAEPLRYAVELRSPACVDAAFMALLRKHQIAFVIVDKAGRFPYAEEITTDFVGDTPFYASDYGPCTLARWAERIARWSDGGRRYVYVYFDNDGSAHAPHNALSLRAALKRRR